MHIHPIAAVALACSVFLLVYLVIALLYPEKF
jgi:K+-transporting ATPase KdpF subunit